jgi:hypothetical protein
MSTKINVRSPFYLSYSEPAEPSVELTCELINLTGGSIDQFGVVTLPNAIYGTILSYDCSDSDFSDGKFDTVVTDTDRTITFTIGIPEGFTNLTDSIDCDLTLTQPEFVCTGGVTTNGTIPNQSVDTGGDSVTVDLTSYFTQGVDPIQGYIIINTHTNYFNAEVEGDILTITGTNIGGTKTFYVEATDNDPLTCNATQPIQVTVSAVSTYTCNDSYITGGIVNQDGSIFQPTANGTITAIKETSGGTPITSLPANNTGSFIQHTLYFDITIPSGYTNAGQTIECSKVYYQVSSALPEFTCEVAGLTNQAITLSGIVVAGLANKGTIKSFTPLSFPAVSTNTLRTVTYTITAPSGYDNTGEDIECDVVLTQPSAVRVCGSLLWYYETFGAFMTYEQVQAAYPNENDLFYQKNCVEGRFKDIYGTPISGNFQLQPTNCAIALQSTNIRDNVNTLACYADFCYTGTIRDSKKILYNSKNPTGGTYVKVTPYREYPYGPNVRPTNSSAQTATSDYFLKVEASSFITEVWFVDWVALTFTRID